MEEEFDLEKLKKRSLSHVGHGLWILIHVFFFSKDNKCNIPGWIFSTFSIYEIQTSPVQLQLSCSSGSNKVSVNVGAAKNGVLCVLGQKTHAYLSSLQKTNDICVQLDWILLFYERYEGSYLKLYLSWPFTPWNTGAFHLFRGKTTKAAHRSRVTSE